MPAPAKQQTRAAPIDALGDIARAIESGATMPDLARACGRALAASVAVIDASSSVLAVACSSPDEESMVLSGEAGTQVTELAIGGTAVGRLHYRSRGDAAPDGDLLKLVCGLLALGVERSTAPGRASEAAVRDFIQDIVTRKLTDRENLVARGHELGVDLGGGGSVIVARATPQQPEEGDWPARVLAVAERGARAVERTCLVAAVELPLAAPDSEIVVVVPSDDGELARRVIGGVRSELQAALPSFLLALGRSRVATDPADLHRAAAEAVLAANVAQTGAGLALNFEETGAYRLLLSSMTDNPAELRRFHEETVEPLVQYDDQYETELLRTLETFLDENGNVAQTAQRLFTHRHTIRYRLERVRELTNLDVSSTDGRERLSLGLKAMRVLGIAPPRGPANEEGAETGRVPKEPKDR